LRRTDVGYWLRRFSLDELGSSAILL